MGAKGGGLTDLAVGSNGQTAEFLPDLSEKRPRGNDRLNRGITTEGDYDIAIFWDLAVETL